MLGIGRTNVHPGSYFAPWRRRLGTPHSSLREKPQTDRAGVSKLSTDPLANRLLAELPRPEFDLLRSHLTIGPFAQGTVLAEVGDEIDQIYFPLSGMISLLTILKEGRAIETATIGRNGVFGASAGLGLHKSRVRAIVQILMVAATITAPHFRRAAESSKALQQLCFKYNEVLLAQARVTAACNALHMIEARFCRWLLQTSEVSATKTITLTQEFLAEMLGVRRTSVTEVATKLQSAGLISYSRGVINILDLSGLRERSCECFETLQEQNAI
jgi:CRP-like cAMP-binding protein